MKSKLLDYQQRAYNAVLAYFNEIGGTRCAIAMATGLGKTVLFIALLLELAGLKTKKPKRVLILVHTIDLVEQIYESIDDNLPFLSVRMFGGRVGLGRLQGEHKIHNAQVTVASMQTLGKEVEESEEYEALIKYLEYGPVDLLIIDEGHHGAAPTIHDVILPMLLERNPNLWVMGFSATMVRADGRALDTLYHDVVFSMNIKEAIDQGRLKRIRAELCRPLVRGVEKDIQAVHNEIETVYDVWLEKTGGKRPTAFFMRDVETTLAAAQYWNDRGHPSGAVTYNTAYGPEGDHTQAGIPYRRYRAQILEDKKDNKIKHIFGRRVLMEGWDDPTISCVVIACGMNVIDRTQAIGRGTRRPSQFQRITLDGDDYVIFETYEGRKLRYRVDECPYYYDLLVLDFDPEPTGILLSASLEGTQPNFDLPQEEEVEELETEDIYDITPIDTEVERWLDTADGYRTFEHNYFKMSDEAWFAYDRFMSVYLGLGRGLFIWPRSKTLATKMNRILQMMAKVEGTGIVDDLKLRKSRHQYKAAQLMFNSYLLFSVIADKPSVGPDGVEKSVRWSKAKVSLVSSYPDIQLMWSDALPLSQSMAPTGKAARVYIDRTESWRNKFASEKQINFLTKPTKAGWAVADLIEKANKDVMLRAHQIILHPLVDAKMGYVSSLITHTAMQSLIMLQFMNKPIKQVYKAEKYWEKKYNQIGG